MSTFRKKIMQKCLTDGKTDDILVNCITMLATVPFFAPTATESGGKARKRACFCGVERIKTKGRKKSPLMAGPLPQKT